MAAVDVVLAALLQRCFSLMHISAYYAQLTALEFYSQTCSSHFGMDGIFSGDPSQRLHCHSLYSIAVNLARPL